MSAAARLALVAPDHPDLSIVAQCALLKVPRSTLYYQPAPVDPDELALMKRMDEIFTKWPFYGSRKLLAELCGEGFVVNRKRVQRLMRVMGLEAIYQKPNTSRKHPDHKIYPYLLRKLVIDHANQVWCADITYIPMAQGFVYLVAIMDWFSRRVLAWRVSITMDAEFCVEALLEALDLYGTPEIFNTDQGAQFTGSQFVGTLLAHDIQVSMDGRGRFLDNIFIERLWRSLKYEEVYIHAYALVLEARRGMGAWFAFYNTERKHETFGYKTPAEVYAASRALWICAQRKGVAHIPTGPTAEKDSILDSKRVEEEQFELATQSAEI
jgi:putative transposase